MSLTRGDRVIIDRPGHPAGQVKSVDEDGRSAYVVLDSGSSCSFPVAELSPAPTQAPDTKAWPPEGIETK